jgi:hypothetical protein
MFRHYPGWYYPSSSREKASEIEPPSLAAQKGGPAETGCASKDPPGWGSPKIRTEAVDYGTVALLQ